MNKLFLLLLLPIGVASCNFNKSVSTNLNTGLTTKGNGLSCEDVKLVINDEEITRNELQYAEKLEMYFESMKGFVKKNGELRFGMRMLVTGKQGDTVLFNPDLYAEAEPAKEPQPTLKPFLAIGQPIGSGKEYTLTIHIWDKNGTGTFHAELPFTVKRNQAMKVQQSQITFKECYITDDKTQTLIPGDEVQGGTTIDLFFQGVEGFQENNGACAIDASLLIQDAQGNVLFQETDMLGERPVTPEELREAFVFYVSLPKTQGKIKVISTIRDKNNGNQLKAVTKLKVV